jgi:hypothetical protein
MRPIAGAKRFLRQKRPKGLFCYDQEMKAGTEQELIKNCRRLLLAYKTGELGNTVMPEDSNPGFSKNEQEERWSYFTLPMALNYQRDSYKLWQSALATWQDAQTRSVFSVQLSGGMPVEELRAKLLQYKIALQPNKHVATWQKIAQTITNNWGSINGLIEAADNDYLKLRDIIQGSHKKWFPYLSGPKIFNYWSYILSTYGNIPLENKEYIDIAPDTHVTKCSVLLGIITEEEALKLTRDQISLRWRELLAESGISPIDMHPPLWFWSKNNFNFQLN